MGAEKRRVIGVDFIHQTFLDIDRTDPSVEDVQDHLSLGLLKGRVLLVNLEALGDGERRHYIWPPLDVPLHHLQHFREVGKVNESFRK